MNTSWNPSPDRLFTRMDCCAFHSLGTHIRLLIIKAESIRNTVNDFWKLCIRTESVGVNRLLCRKLPCPI